MRVTLVSAIGIGAMNWSGAQGRIDFGITRMADEESLRVSWSTAPRTALLERSQLTSDGIWEVVQIVPVSHNDRFVVEIPLDAPQDFFRLGEGEIIFVDSDHETEGSGRFFDPFQSLMLGLEEARIRFGENGDPQTLYVFSRAYAEVIAIDGATAPGFEVSIISSKTPLTVGTQVFGGDSRAQLLAPVGQAAVSVRQIESFRLVGFEITASSAPGFEGKNVRALSIADCTVDSNGGQHGVRLTKISKGNVRFHNVTSSNTTESGLAITDYSGEFMVRDDDDDTDQDVLTINGTSDGFAGIDIANSNLGAFTFANVDIMNTGAEGARLNHAGTVRFSAASSELGDEIGATLINTTNGDAINSVNTNLLVTFARIGESGTILGDAIEITNNDGLTRSADLQNTGPGREINRIPI